MKKFSWFILILVFALTPKLWADDTDIYGTSTISMTPNVLIIFDTSGSMSTVDVPGEYYDHTKTYSGSYTGTKVYEKVCGWGCSYDEFATSVDDLNCPDVKTALENNGYKTNASIMDSGGGYICGGSGKDLYLGNWINYDESSAGDLQSRNAVARAVIKQLITDTDNVNFGLMRFNKDPNNTSEGGSQGGRILAPCGTDKATLLSLVDNLGNDGWTPLAETLAEAGLYFAGKKSWFNDSSGYNSNCDQHGNDCYQYTSPMQYRCQKNYIILMTDGDSTQDRDSRLTSGTYINGDTIGDYDNDGEDPGSYSDNGSDYLDDVAKYLYENDINPDLGDPGDTFEKQNITIYTIGFRTDKELLAKTAYNGGGLYYTANSISGLTAAFHKIMTNIADVNAVFVSPVVPMSRMNQAYAGNSLYVGFFKPQSDGHWAGNIKKYGLDQQGSIVDADGMYATLADGTIKDNARSYWSTSADGSDVLKGGIGAKLLDQASRNLYTVIDSSKTLTDADNTFSIGNSLIITSTLDVTTSTIRDSVINDIHGVGKDWKLGDILHSKPAVVHYDTNNDGVFDETFIFTGSNDGMLHCFKDSDGSEVWGFIPPDLLTRLKELSDGSTNHKYFVDGSPIVYEDTSNRKILFFGERRGGYDYHALDVSTYYAPTYLYTIGPSILTNVDGDGDTVVDGANATLGQSWAEPTAHEIKTSSTTSETVFLMAGGYDTNQDKPIYVYDPADPAPDMSQFRANNDTNGRAVFTINYLTGAVSKLDFNAGNYSEMTHCIVDVSGFDSNGNGYTNRVYAGDLGGNIFAFEDDDGDGTWSRRKFFSSSAADGEQRKIFYAPDAVEETFGEMIFFGTGDRADPEGTEIINRIYAIKNYWEDLSTFTTPLTESDLYDATEDLIALAKPTDQALERQRLAEKKGWFIKLDQHAGEKVTSPMLVFNGVMYFTTYTPDTTTTTPSDPCETVSGHGQARLYALNYETGEAAFDWSNIAETDGDGNTVAVGRSDRSKIIGTSIASAPVIAILKGALRMYTGVPKGVLTGGVGATAALNTFFWRQMNN
jgi:type IV pilus assembly protein PilY1